MINRRDSEFERWLFDGRKSLKDAATECDTILRALYDHYHENWQQGIKEKAESLTEVKKP